MEQLLNRISRRGGFYVQKLGSNPPTWTLCLTVGYGWPSWTEKELRDIHSVHGGQVNYLTIEGNEILNWMPKDKDAILLLEELRSRAAKADMHGKYTFLDIAVKENRLIA